MTGCRAAEITALNQGTTEVTPPGQTPRVCLAGYLAHRFRGSRHGPPECEGPSTGGLPQGTLGCGDCAVFSL